MGNTIEIILTIIGLSFWFLFPVGIFLSVSKLDKNTDQVIRLNHPKLEQAENEGQYPDIPPYHPKPFDWHHPVMYFRNWLQHE